jgi:uncharacterized paraquat-inducible protein A
MALIAHGPPSERKEPAAPDTTPVRLRTCPACGNTINRDNTECPRCGVTLRAVLIRRVALLAAFAATALWFAERHGWVHFW